MPAVRDWVQLRRKEYLALSSSTFLNSAGSNIQLGIWPFYLQRNNVGDELYGTLSTASSLFGILARLVSSKLGAVGESLPFAVGLVASTSMLLSYAFLPGTLGIAVGMGLSAVSMALVMVGRTTLVGRKGPNERLATSYAILITLANIGLIVGTNVGAFIFPFTDYVAVFLLGASLCLTGLVIAILTLPRASVPSRTGFGVMKLEKVSPVLKRFYVATCLDSFSWSIAGPFFSITPARIFHVTQADIALIQTLMFGASTATNVVFATLSDRLWGRKSLLLLSEGLGVAMFALYVLSPNIQPIFLSAVLMGMVISSWGPIVSAYVSEVSTREELNDNVGTWMTLTALVRVPAPMIGGYLAERLFPRAPYVVSLFLVAGTALYIQKSLREPVAEK